MCILIFFQGLRLSAWTVIKCILGLLSGVTTLERQELRLGIRVVMRDQVYLMGSQSRVLISIEHPVINFENQIEVVKH